MVVAVTLTLLLCMSVFAQGPADLTTATPEAAAAAPAPAAANRCCHTRAANPPRESGSTDRRSQSATVTVGAARISIYGWFSGVHGTVGVLGHDAGIHVPFCDLFHYLKGIIPIAVEADKGRFVMPIDYLWLKLGDDKAHSLYRPEPDLGQYPSDGVDLDAEVRIPVA